MSDGNGLDAAAIPVEQMADKAGKLIGFKAAVDEFKRKITEIGGASDAIVFVCYPDDSVWYDIHGAIPPHRVSFASVMLAQRVHQDMLKALNHIKMLNAGAKAMAMQRGIVKP